MGYELVPSGLPSLPAAAALLRRALDEDPADPAAVLRRDPATADLGLFVIHAGWALVGPAELAGLLEAEAAAGRADAAGTRRAARLAMAVVERKRQKEGTALSGFKVQTSRFGVFRRLFPDSRLPGHRPRPPRCGGVAAGPGLQEVGGAHSHPLARLLRASRPLRPLPPGTHAGGALRGPGGRPRAPVRAHLRPPATPDTATRCAATGSPRPASTTPGTTTPRRWGGSPSPRAWAAGARTCSRPTWPPSSGSAGGPWPASATRLPERGPRFSRRRSGCPTSRR